MRTLLKLFVSLKSAVVIIIILSLLSVIGTLVPQMSEAGDYLRQYPRFGHWILALGFDDIFHGTIFQVCLWLLAISTFLCTMIRIRLTHRKFLFRLKHVSEKEIQAMQASLKIDSAKEVCNSEYFTETKELDNGTLIALKTFGKFSLIGGLLIHIGFLMLLAGGLIGGIYGVEMTINGKKGDIVPVPTIKAIAAAMQSDRLARKGRNIRQFSPSDPQLKTISDEIDRLRAIYIAGQASPSFRLSLNKLWVDHYKDKKTGMNEGVKGWNTTLAVLENRIAVATASLSVNNPFTYAEMTFYQANWNKVYSKVKLKVDYIEGVSGWENFELKPGFSKDIELTIGEKFKPEWSPVSFTLKEFMPDFRVMNGRFVSVSNELHNPAGQIVSHHDDGAVAGRAWAFSKRVPAMSNHASNLPFRFTFEAAEPVFETGLQVSYDPGKPLVWIGSFIFTLGLFMAFYIVYREEWYIKLPNKSFVLAVSGAETSENLKNHLTTLQVRLFGKNDMKEEI